MRLDRLELSDQAWIDIADAKRAKALALRSKADPTAWKRRQAWIDTIVGTGATHAVTLTWNPEDGWLDLGQVGIAIRKAHCRVDRALMKRGYNKLPVAERTGYVGFIEHPETNTHAHLAWRVPIEHHGRFVIALTDWWDRLHPYGEVQADLIHDAVGWASYISKCQWRTPRAEDAALLLASHTISK